MTNKMGQNERFDEKYWTVRWINSASLTVEIIVFFLSVSSMHFEVSINIGLGLDDSSAL